MWIFQSPQQKFTIGKVILGGLPGENPTVLIGSIFYHNQKKIWLNTLDGIFNREEAEKLIKIQEEFADRTGLQSMLDVVIPSRKCIEKIIDFICSVTNSSILIDSPSVNIRIEALKYAGEIGVLEKCIYNSLNPESSELEINKVREIGVGSVILLAYNTKDLTSNGKIKAIKELIPKVKDLKILIDTCVIDIPSLGLALKAMLSLKSEYGYPVGCGAHNAIETWRGLKTKMGTQSINPCIAAANTITLTAGADFILYGPIENAPIVFPAVAMVNAALSQLLIEEGKLPPKNSPIFKIG
ncbi:MAG: tetrahydromethanopterin S-methyltransferase subunit H [Candidatus Methanomethylicia archaeon]